MQYTIWLLGNQAIESEAFRAILNRLNTLSTSAEKSDSNGFVPTSLRLSMHSSFDLMTLKTRIHELLKGSGLDFIIKPKAEENIRPELIIMDMDSTLVQAETIDQIAKHAGVMDKVSAITESAMRGELDFTQSLTERVAMLRGLSHQDLAPVHDTLPLTQGAEELINKARQHNCLTVLVSGGFTYFAEPLAKRLGINEVYANHLGFKDGHLTGLVDGEIVDAEFKRATLERLINERNIDRQNTIAVGDGANDLLMLGAAGTGIAFHGKPKVQQQATAMINVHGLDTIGWWLGW